jgi:UDP-N-acetylmuramyl tripeptide synthase
MNILDSRRLTGPGLLLDGPGAVLDLRLEQPETDRVVAAWQNATRRLLQAVGWQNEILASRPFPGGVSLAFTAPIDGLYAATELNERAWAIAAAELRGERAPDFRAAVASLLDDIEDERNPVLVEIYRQAQTRRLNFLSGEDLVSVGSGPGALIWRVDDLPDPGAVDWTSARDIPIALVTGSNGKTTVVRLLAAMAEAAGISTGSTSTDGIVIGDSLLEEGDFSGPSGARMVLRHPAVQMAILETARGGILRRGLPVERANVAVITNIADDHLGEFGVESLPDLATTKLLVTKALGSKGTLVLNADDPLLVERSRDIDLPMVWFSLNPYSPTTIQSTHGRSAVVVEEGTMVLAREDQRVQLAPIEAVPITFGGTARHNIANALAAAAGATALGIGAEPITQVLRRFGRDLEDNPGRGNLLDLGGVRLLLDFAHNPHGMSALVEMAAAIPARRRLVLMGQAGDRSDEAIRALARAAWALAPDHVVVKELTEYLRGRPLGEVSQLLAEEFTRLGLPEEAITRAAGEIEGMRAALEWARPGDLLVLAIHQDRAAVLDFLDGLKEAEWKAGDSLPEHLVRA